MLKSAFQKQTSPGKRKSITGWVYRTSTPTAAKPMAHRRPAGARFPLLIADIGAAGTIRIARGNDGRDEYEFRLFSVGERGQSLSYELVDEVVDGLTDEMRPGAGDIDCIVSIEPGGVRWALAVARELRKPLKVITSQPAAATDQQQIIVEQVAGFYPHRQLHFPRIEPGSRVAVIDDVLSTGGTVRAVLEGLRLSKVVVLGVYTIIDKVGASLTLEREDNIVTRSLIRIN